MYRSASGSGTISKSFVQLELSLLGFWSLAFAVQLCSSNLSFNCSGFWSLGVSSPIYLSFHSSGFWSLGFSSPELFNRLDNWLDTCVPEERSRIALIYNGHHLTLFVSDHMQEKDDTGSPLSKATVMSAREIYNAQRDVTSWAGQTNHCRVASVASRRKAGIILKCRVFILARLADSWMLPGRNRKSKKLWLASAALRPSSSLRIISWESSTICANPQQLKFLLDWVNCEVAFDTLTSFYLIKVCCFWVLHTCIISWIHAYELGIHKNEIHEWIYYYSWNMDIDSYWMKEVDHIPYSMLNSTSWFQNIKFSLILSNEFISWVHNDEFWLMSSECVLWF